MTMIGRGHGNGSTVRRPLVVGVGNRDRGDDAIGPLVADAFAESISDVGTLVAEGDLSDLAMKLHADQRVVIVDAMFSGRPPGSIIELDAMGDRLPVGAGLVSSHGVGLAEAVELGRLLGRLPQQLIVVGVEGATFDQFADVTQDVVAAIPIVVARVAEILDVDEPEIWKGRRARTVVV